VNRRSRPSPAIRSRLAAVRPPGAGMAPVGSGSARRQVRCCAKTGAKARTTAASRRAGARRRLSAGTHQPTAHRLRRLAHAARYVAVAPARSGQSRA
jgi:hypothetical protein